MTLMEMTKWEEIRMLQHDFHTKDVLLYGSNKSQASLIPLVLIVEIRSMQTL